MTFIFQVIEKLQDSLRMFDNCWKTRGHLNIYTPLYPSLSFYVIEYDDYYTFIFIFDELWEEKKIIQLLRKKFVIWFASKEELCITYYRKKKHELLMMMLLWTILKEKLLLLSLLLLLKHLQTNKTYEMKTY